MPAATQPTGTYPYSTIGPYSSGVWLVKGANGAALMDRRHLPPEGTGFQYYWLGTTRDQALYRLLSAMDKLGAAVPQGVDLGGPIDKALGGQPVTLPHGQGGIVGAIENALRGGIFVTGPLPTLGAEGAGAGAAAGAGEGAAGGAAAGGAASGAAGKLAAAGLVGLLGLTDGWQALLIRVLEALAAIALLLLGLQALTGTGGQGNPVATVRRYAK